MEDLRYVMSNTSSRYHESLRTLVHIRPIASRLFMLVAIRQTTPRTQSYNACLLGQEMHALERPFHSVDLSSVSLASL